MRPSHRGHAGGAGFGARRDRSLLGMPRALGPALVAPTQRPQKMRDSARSTSGRPPGTAGFRAFTVKLDFPMAGSLAAPRSIKLEARTPPRRIFVHP